MYLILGLWSSGFAQGSWSPVYTSDNMIASASANLPDGKILSWSAFMPTSFNQNDNGRTYTSIFDPTTNSFLSTIVSNTGHDMFCPGTANLEDGTIMVTGGSSSDKTSFYNPNSNTWTAGPRLKIARGYHSMATLTDGRVFTVGGSWNGVLANKKAEIWSASTGWQTLDNIDSNATVRQGSPDPEGVIKDDTHAWLFAAPGGDVYQLGPGTDMHYISTAGQGSVTDIGKRANNPYSNVGCAVMYDRGKVLTFGGAPSYAQRSPATNQTHTIDISGGVSSVSVARVGNLNAARAYPDGVVLPNGEVVVIGGINRSEIFTDVGAVMTAEIWNPSTGNWTVDAAMSVPRTYHSSAVLMKDGRVWVGGGGLCGNCPANHPDAQIYSPPYLYNANGTLAAQPRLERVPALSNYNSSITVQSNQSVNSFVLIRLGSATHSVNLEQRRIPVSFQSNGGNNYTVNIPNSDWLPPGNYWLFGINGNGVPSIGEPININNNNTNNNSGCTAGTACNDNNPCTINDALDANCNCAGIFQDSDSDGICNANDECPNDAANTCNTPTDGNNGNNGNSSDCEYTLLPGVALDIGSGGGKTYVIGTNGQIFLWENNAWNPLPLSFQSVKLDVTSAGIPWVVASNNLIYYFENNQWNNTDGLALDVGCSGNTVCVIGINNDVFKRVNNVWQIMPGELAQRIDVGGDGNPWITDLNGNIHQYTNGQWAVRGNLIARDISIAEGSSEVWALAQATSLVHEYNGNGVWNQKAGTATDLSVGNDRTVWVINEAGSIFSGNCYNGTTGPACNVGGACNDGDDCTTNDVFDTNCNCIGTFQDTDNDGICNANDQCPNDPSNTCNEPEPVDNEPTNNEPTNNEPVNNDGSCTVTFSNTGCQDAAFYWNDGQSLTQYGVVPANNSVTQSTYSGHLWEFQVNGSTVGNYTVDCNNTNYSFDAGGCDNSNTNNVGGDIILYADCDYRGQSLSLGVGDYPDIASIGFPDNILSSLRIPRGYSVTLYMDTNFRGGFTVLGGDYSCLLFNGFNDVVSSIKITRTQGRIAPTTTSSIGVNPSLSFESELTDLIELYPNPASNILNISSPILKGQTVDYQIYSITGKEMAIGRFEVDEANANRLEVPLNHIGNGIYIINLQTIQQQVVKRFIIEKE